MNHSPRYDNSYWLSNVLRTDELKKTVREAQHNLKELQFDAIAFRGMSGALLAPLIVFGSKRTLILVRKGERRHSTKRVEGDCAARRYVIVDDMVDSGKTIFEIVSQIKMFSAQAECVGVYLYRHPELGVRPVLETMRRTRYYKRLGGKDESLADC